MDEMAQSPCVRNCCLNDGDMCLGCFRSLEEIKEWGLANNQDRLLILQNAKQRRERVTPRSAIISTRSR